jgi:hypothetical protein
MIKTVNNGHGIALTLVTGDDMAVYGLDEPAIILHDEHEDAWAALDNERCWFVMVSEIESTIGVLEELKGVGE